MECMKFPSTATLWSPTRATSSGSPRLSTSLPAPLRFRTFLSINRTAPSSFAPGRTTTQRWTWSSPAISPAVTTSPRAGSGTSSLSQHVKTRTPGTSHTLTSLTILSSRGNLYFIPSISSFRACWSRLWPSWSSICPRTAGRRWRCVSRCCWLSLCSCS